MATPSIAAFLLSLLLPLFLPSSARSCLADTSFSQNRLYAFCNSLPHLGATLHWNYHSSNGTVDVAYRAPQSSHGWISWALNPSGHGMIGAQALIAFPGSAGAMTVYAVPLSGYDLTVRDGNLSFPVYSKEAEYSNNAMTIYATVGLPGNHTRVNQVWQAGIRFAYGVPLAHPLNVENTQSFGTLDFLSGGGGGENSRQRRKNIHGVLNAVSWGILMPVGAIIARYLRVFKSGDPAWFYLHAACQCSAYLVGVAGWGTGLKLGGESAGITYHSHRAFGIALFSIATLQVFALPLRPTEEHKFRIYWNVYHQLIGYGVIILGVINIFKGFDILKPAESWKHAYIAVIVTLGGVSLVLEVGTWAIVLKRLSRGSEESHRGANGAKVGDREQQAL